MAARKRSVRTWKPAEARSTGAAAGVVAAILGTLGAAAYLAAVLFAIGDGGVVTEADLVAERIVIGTGGALGGAALVAALVALRRPKGRGAATIGLVLGAAFLALAGLSLLRAA